ncbi:Uncharacterised protein [Mycobacteroides abscessus]|nr:Uncharacterised protein [Mycobacteroides abscessus]
MVLSTVIAEIVTHASSESGMPLWSIPAELDRPPSSPVPGAAQSVTAGAPSVPSASAMTTCTWYVCDSPAGRFTPVAMTFSGAPSAPRPVHVGDGATPSGAETTAPDTTVRSPSAVMRSVTSYVPSAAPEFVATTS